MRKTKQTYVKPETEVVELRVQGQILAGSDFNDGEGGSGSQEGGEL